MDKEQIINMPLHTVKELNKDLTIIRVLGGYVCVYKGSVSEFISLRGKD